jgi:CHC2 zinc finger
MSIIDEAKERLPLPTLMNQLGLGEHAKKSARCPFHEDKHNSFSVWQQIDGGWHFKCHAGCGTGNEIDFLQKHKGISQADATKLFLEIARVNGYAAHHPTVNDRPAKPQFNWRACVEALKPEHLERLADWRGYSGTCCSWLHQRALVGLYRDCIAFPIQDSGKVVAAHYRLKDGSWRVFPHGTKMRPLVIGEPSTAEVVHVFESQWDACAVADKLALYEKEHVALITTRGASNGKLLASLIPRNATVFAWKQNDRAGDDWLKGVAAHAGVSVQAVTTPPQFKDANDWTKGRCHGSRAGERVRSRKSSSDKPARYS